MTNAGDPRQGSMEEVSMRNLNAPAIVYKTYYVDGVPRVSIDGDSHEILTLVACVSGFVVASLVIFGIIMAMKYGKAQSRPNQVPANGINQTDSDTDIKRRTCKGRSSIFTIFGNSRQSFDVEHNV